MIVKCFSLQQNKGETSYRTRKNYFRFFIKFIPQLKRGYNPINKRRRPRRYRCRKITWTAKDFAWSWRAGNAEVLRWGSNEAWECREIFFTTHSSAKVCEKIHIQSTKISIETVIWLYSIYCSYKLRIECMLLKEEFAANMGYLEPSINSMILAGEDLMTNKPLQEVLYMVLVAGNFLNSVRYSYYRYSWESEILCDVSFRPISFNVIIALQGGYAGNAAGVKLSSLQKLTEIRANKPGMNLIHYVALVGFSNA